MGHYILKRLLLIFPTILGILTVTFLIVQFTPGGPVEIMVGRMQAMMQQHGNRALSASAEQSTAEQAQAATTSHYRGSEGLDPVFIQELKKQFGFDKPPLQRYFKMLWDFLRFDFGHSFFKGRTVLQLIGDALPVSLSLGFWQLFFAYLIAIPLGIRKAVRDGSRFDVWTSLLIIVSYAVPPFIFGILLLLFFAGGSFYNIFPLGHLLSDNFSHLSLLGKIGDYVWHLTLPVLSMVIYSFASVTFLTKNCFLEELSKQYVITARAKGVTERRILYHHVFRNAILVVISGFPAAFIAAFFTGAILIETTFSLNGLGLLGFDAVVSRDYPVVFGTLFIFSLLGLLLNLLGDIACTLIDPRIDFEKRDV